MTHSAPLPTCSAVEQRPYPTTFMINFRSEPISGLGAEYDYLHGPVTTFTDLFWCGSRVTSVQARVGPGALCSENCD
jgi:hypothetical protein